MAELISIVYKPENSPRDESAFTRIPRSEARLISDYGIDGDAKGGRRQRQLNIMSEETIRALEQAGYRTGQGQLGENLVISGLDIESLAPGTRLRIGDSAVVELLELRQPCSRFEACQGRSLDDAIERVGWMAAVVSSGEIRLADPVAILASEPALSL